MTSRVASDNPVIWDVSNNDGTSSHYAITTDCNSWTDECPGCDPGATADIDWAIRIRHAPASCVMPCCSQVYFMRQCYVVPQNDRLKVQQLATLSDPAIVANLEFPGKMNVNAPTDVETFSDSCPKAPQESASNSAWPRNWCQEEQEAGQAPGRFDNQPSSSVKAGILVEEVIPNRVIFAHQGVLH